jgi:WD40 repeat protein
MRAIICSVLALLAGAVAPVSAQIDRRDRRNPELIVEAGGRLSTCDQLVFTKDGKYLLAAGDDKVVRVWRVVGGRLDATGLPPLRWITWREQRGAIFALAVSPDSAGSRVAIGGYGAQSSAVAVLDRATGRQLHYAVPETPQPEGKAVNYFAVMQIAFAPDGERVAFGTGDGSVFLWGLKKNTVQRLGRHAPKDEEELFNRIRLVHFEDDEHLLTAAADGSMARWDLSKAKPQREMLPPIKGERVGGVFRIALSPDGRRLAAATAPTGKGAAVVVRSIDGKDSTVIPLGKLQSARAVAFDADGKRIAAAVGSFTVNDAGFIFENDYQIHFYNLTDSPPTETEGPPQSYRADRLAFNPKGGQLAVAGGENHEVALWDVANLKEPASVARSAGACLWDVGLSADGRYLGFRDQRDPKSEDVNRRGRGAWRVFDLEQRNWSKKPATFEPLKQLRTAGGWTVAGDPNNPFRWYAVDGDGKKYALPTQPAQDDKPRCFVFLPAEGKKPVRLLVGHYYGVSVFELTASGVRRSRLYTGHQGEVTAIAVSKDRQWFVTSSNDQTINAWSLKDWKYQPDLGAEFEKADARTLAVTGVDPNSPASESGLVKGDQIIKFAFNGREVEGGPDAWLKRLQNPVAGLEHWFRLKRLTPSGKPVELLTTVRQRPLWRFFPAGDDWVLWMWRHSYYDCSTNGDSFIGWQVNNPDLRREPDFYRAEQFRDIYWNQPIIETFLKTRDIAAAVPPEELKLPRSFAANEPPLAAMTLNRNTVTRQDVVVTLTATPRDEKNRDFELERAELWINDYRVRSWQGATLDEWKRSKRDGEALQSLSIQVTLPNDKLRSGTNLLTLQTFNRNGGRADAVQRLTCERDPDPPQLYGLMIGINKYGQTKVGKDRGSLNDLKGARKDAESLHAVWEGQVKLYKGTRVTPLLDEDADRTQILKALDGLKEKVGPEDRLVLFMAGHGAFVELPGAPGQPAHTQFVFCCPKYDSGRPLATGISTRELAEKLAALPCRKLVLLDACHSGEAATNPVRELTPSNQGPTILAACDRTQLSFEDPEKHHGLFTLALLEAMGDRFDQADGDDTGKKDGYLDAVELFQYARKRMPELLKENKMAENEQRPICFPPRPERYRVAARPK